MGDRGAVVNRFVGQVLLLGWLAGAGLANASAQGQYELGLASTRSGNHAEAEAALHQALADGARHSAVYLALGNTLYRRGRVGPAMAAWRRGLVLAPRDGDIAANLSRARAQTVDRLEPEPVRYGPFFWQAWLSPRDSAVLAGVFGFLFLSLVALRQGGRQVQGSLVILVAVLAGLFLGSTTIAMRAPLGAVVVVPEVSGRSALGPEGVELFRLHEGAEVRVMEADRRQNLVILPDGRKGWVAEDALISVEPAAPFPHESFSEGSGSD